MLSLEMRIKRRSGRCVAGVVIVPASIGQFAVRWPNPSDRRQRGCRHPKRGLRMIQALRSVDRDEVVYQVMLVFSIAFASLRVFLMVHMMVGPVSAFITQIAGLVGAVV